MQRILSFSVALAMAILVAVGAHAQTAASQTTTTTTTTTTKKTASASPARTTKAAHTKEWKLRNAMSAAPMAVSKEATIMDWPSAPGGTMTVLRKGKNQWTCMPDDPDTPANDPMCMDSNAADWAKAWKEKRTPNIPGVGLAYMLQGGGTPSNTDPYATKPDAGKDWLKEPPHLMIFGAKLDPKVYSTDPTTGKPWIMWPGTPYEHLMVPVK